MSIFKNASRGLICDSNTVLEGAIKCVYDKIAIENFAARTRELNWHYTLGHAQNI